MLFDDLSKRLLEDVLRIEQPNQIKRGRSLIGTIERAVLEEIGNEIMVDVDLDDVPKSMTAQVARRGVNKTLHQSKTAAMIAR